MEPSLKREIVVTLSLMGRLTRNIQRWEGRHAAPESKAGNTNQTTFSESPSKSEEGCGGASSTPPPPPPPTHTHRPQGNGTGGGAKQQGGGQARSACCGFGRSQGSQAPINKSQRQQRFLPTLSFCQRCSTSPKRKSFYQRRHIISIISRHLSLIIPLRSGV